MSIGSCIHSLVFFFCIFLFSMPPAQGTAGRGAPALFVVPARVDPTPLRFPDDIAVATRKQLVKFIAANARHSVAKPPKKVKVDSNSGAETIAAAAASTSATVDGKRDEL